MSNSSNDNNKTNINNEEKSTSSSSSKKSNNRASSSSKQQKQSTRSSGSINRTTNGSNKNNDTAINSNNNKQKGQLRKIWSSISSSTLQASGILLLAIVTSIVYNRTVDPVDVNHQSLVNLMCKNSNDYNHFDSDDDEQQSNDNDNAAFCHEFLVPARRSLIARRMIPAGSLVLEVPRRLQIWDLDALQDPEFMQKNNLLNARLQLKSNLKSNTLEEHPLPSAAFLAVYLAHKIWINKNQKAAGGKNNNTVTSKEDAVTNTADDILSHYLSALPTYDDYAAFHPVLWSPEELQKRLGSYTYAYGLVSNFQALYRDEYAAFSKVAAASKRFRDTIRWEDYVTARLHVATRAFGTGSSLNYETVVSKQLFRSSRSSSTADAALEHLKNGMAQAGFIETPEDISNYFSNNNGDGGCFAMVPILDSYDHHARPHVKYSLDTNRRSFVISAIQNMRPGQQVFDSYGKVTDSFLFAKYGFVNGDGSDFVQASIALWHLPPILQQQQDNIHNHLYTDPSLQHYQAKILRYLQYDNGYQECIIPSHTEAWELKKLKFKHLLARSTAASNWVVNFPPRSKESQPAMASNMLITTTPPSFEGRSSAAALTFNTTGIFGTCRLISVTHLHYGGNAIEMLRTNLDSLPYYTLPEPFPETFGSLEFQTLMCVARFAATAMSKFPRSLADQYDLVARLNQEKFPSNEWSVEQVKLGEMQGLEALKRLVYHKMALYDDYIDSAPEYTVRDQPCDKKMLHLLLLELIQEQEQEKELAKG